MTKEVTKEEATLEGRIAALEIAQTYLREDIAGMRRVVKQLACEHCYCRGVHSGYPFWIEKRCCRCSRTRGRSVVVI